MMRQKRIPMGTVTPVLVFLVVLIAFAILTGGTILNATNLQNLVDQAIPILICGCGMIFVIAQGSVDMTSGGIMGLSAAVGAVLYQAMDGGTAGMVVMILTILVMALLIGFLNGILVAVCRVNSFMVTLAMSIALRGLQAFVVKESGTVMTLAMRKLNQFPIKITILVLCLAVCVYLLHCNRFGRKCTAIGENEQAVRCVGIPVTRVKVAAFMLSGLFAALATYLSIARQGGSTQTMGSNFELDVMFAMFAGGIAVTGGRSAKVINFVIGAFTINVMEISLVLCGWSSGEMKQLIEGLILLVLLFLSQKTKSKVLYLGNKTKVAQSNG